MDVASEYKKIAERIKLFKNGEVSEQIQNLGLAYESCLGLSIPVVDEISAELPKNNELALFCWNQTMRESKLIALRIFDVESIDKTTVDSVIEGINNTELSEQAAHKLFFFCKDRINLAKRLIISSNEFVQYTGLILIRLQAKTENQENDSKFVDILEEMYKIEWKDKLHLKRALAGALLQIGQRNNLLEQKVLIWINNYNFDNQNITNWIEKEVVYFFETKTE